MDSSHGYPSAVLYHDLYLVLFLSACLLNINVKRSKWSPDKNVLIKINDFEEDKWQHEWKTSLYIQWPTEIFE